MGGRVRTAWKGSRKKETGTEKGSGKAEGCREVGGKERWRKTGEVRGDKGKHRGYGTKRRKMILKVRGKGWEKAVDVGERKDGGQEEEREGRRGRLRKEERRDRGRRGDREVV